MNPAPSPPVLQHLAIVMDGNGRWATQRHKPRGFGHSAGQRAVRKTVEFCLHQHIKHLTLFAFSSENWQRPATEVKALMQLFAKAINKETAELHQQNVQIHFMGNLEGFSDDLQQRMHQSMQTTANNQALILNVAVNYGGRWDIVHAARQLCSEVEAQRLHAEDITEDLFNTYTCLGQQPPPDLLIRTGGDYRISNFLLWQLAYTELYFTTTLWPDINQECLQQAIDDYARRQRRFGKTAAQVTTQPPHDTQFHAS